MKIKNYLFLSYQFCRGGFQCLVILHLFVVGALFGANHISEKKTYDSRQTGRLKNVIRYLKSNDDRSVVGAASNIISLVQANADPNCWHNDKKEFLLTTYVYNNQIEAVKCLLDHKADPNTEGSFRHNTPLHAAESPEMIDLLLCAGADISLHGASVLYSGVGKSAQVLAKICQAGVNPNVLNGDGYSALSIIFRHLAFKRYELEESEVNEVMKKVGVLFWYGACVDRKCEIEFVTLEEMNPTFASQLCRSDEKLSKKREDTHKALAELIAATTFNGATVLGDLIARYAGLPDLMPADIDAWGAIISDAQESASN